MYQALYRKYRPKTFDDVVGQQVILKILTNSVLKNKISHAYLFTGPRGTGKTSVAKILAKIVNCQNLDGIIPCNHCVSCDQFNNRQNTDIIEIDAASNNGVDEIRELRDKVSLVPSFGKYKIYIIDEVHMLTIAAFNALLKTLEEPPSHIIFILATTEPHKIPQTILSRCQRFDFSKISNIEIKRRLTQICENEKINIDESALDLIANLSDGGMRDSISLLDQLTVYSTEKIIESDVHDVYGTINDIELEKFIFDMLDNNTKQVIEKINYFDSNGKNFIKITERLINILKNCIIYSSDSNYFKDSKIKQMYDKICKSISENKIFYVIDELLNLINQSKNTKNYKILFEIYMLKILGNINKQEKLIKNESKEPVFEEKKHINVEKNVKIELNKIDREKYDKLKKIRINNTLSKYSKKEVIEFKEQIEELKNYVLDQEYGEVASTVLDGELKAKGNNNLIFVYKIPKMDEYFNINIIKIQNLLNKNFGKDYFPIAVSSDEWELIKKDFNDSKKNKENKYIYMKENIDLSDIIKVNDNTKETVDNNIEKNFGDIIAYD